MPSVACCLQNLPGHSLFWSIQLAWHSQRSTGLCFCNIILLRQTRQHEVMFRRRTYTRRHYNSSTWLVDLNWSTRPSESEQRISHCQVSWQRVRAASALAKSGEEYARIMQKYNTGTYNNQYMVVDFNLYKPGKELPPGTLWVIDQVPGLVAAADMTETLSRGYWPSYNVPYFQEVRQHCIILVTETCCWWALEPQRMTPLALS